MLLPLLIATIVLTLLYGLFWHNQPANDRKRAWKDDNHEEELRAALGLRRPTVSTCTKILRQGSNHLAKVIGRKTTERKKNDDINQRKDPGKPLSP